VETTCRDAIKGGFEAKTIQTNIEVKERAASKKKTLKKKKRKEEVRGNFRVK